MNTTKYGPTIFSPDRTVSITSWSETVNKPTADKRPLPVDLFAASTGRTVWYSVIQNGIAVVRPAEPQFSRPAVYKGISPGTRTSFDYASDINAFRQKCVKAVKNQSANLAQSLATYPQTVKMFANAATTVLSTYRNLRRGNLAGAFRSMSGPGSSTGKRFANRYLESEFGWKPMLQDLEGACNALGNSLKSGTWIYLTVKSSTSNQKTTTAMEADYGRVKDILEENETVFRKAMIRYMIVDPNLVLLKQLGLTNPASLAYDLIPYSFVFNYLINVGAWLESLDAFAGITVPNVVYGTKTVRDNIREVGGTVCYSHSETKSRTQMTTLTKPTLMYKPSKSLKAVSTNLAMLKQLRPTTRPY